MSSAQQPRPANSTDSSVRSSPATSLFPQHPVPVVCAHKSPASTNPCTRTVHVPSQVLLWRCRLTCHPSPSFSAGLHNRSRPCCCLQVSNRVVTDAALLPGSSSMSCKIGGGSGKTATTKALPFPVHLPPGIVIKLGHPQSHLTPPAALVCLFRCQVCSRPTSGATRSSAGPTRTCWPLPSGLVCRSYSQVMLLLIARHIWDHTCWVVHCNGMPSSLVHQLSGS